MTRVLDQRAVVTLMHRLWPGSSIADVDGWRHLLVDEKLDRQRVQALLDDYIGGEIILLYADSQHATACGRDQAFEHIRTWIAKGQVKIADPQFHGRVLINSLGVGVGNSARLRSQPKADV